jgi:methylglyoxal synthase
VKFIYGLSFCIFVPATIQNRETMKQKKTIGIVSHDNRKKDMSEWVAWNWKELSPHSLVCTGTTGKLVEDAIRQKCEENNEIPPSILKLKSGPLGGDQQLGAMIAEGKIDMLIFFWDPMQPQPHDVDVKALLRISVLYNIPTASNRSTADFLISSKLFHEEYEPILKDYSTYISRDIIVNV